MDYSDDGLTLDYDNLKGSNPLNLVILKSTKRGGPQKIERDEFCYYDRRRLRKSSNAIKSNDQPALIPDSLKSLVTAELPAAKPESLDLPNDKLEEEEKPHNEPEDKLSRQTKKIIKVPRKRGRKKKSGAGSMIIKKPKRIFRKAKIDTESTKDHSNESIKSDIDVESNQKKDEINPKTPDAKESREFRKSRIIEKQKTEENVEKLKKNKEKPLFDSEEKEGPHFLVNSVPSLIDRFKNRKIQEVNRLFSINPLNPLI